LARRRRLDAELNSQEEMLTPNWMYRRTLRERRLDTKDLAARSAVGIPILGYD
jgi:hypothetical protein